MDLAAVLDRHPAVVLVDDLGRHAAEISALRAAGIHVISTAEVADIARTAAEVSAVTGEPAPGTVSDGVLDSIDALQFVDSSPEALRKRLSHGNIYRADQVEQAMSTQFQPVRLAALREIGLRLVGQSEPAPDAARQRGPQDVLVAVWRPEQVDTLVQHGIRLARRRGARCCVLALGQQNPAAAGLTERVEAAATAGGASVVVRDSRDAGAAIISAVQELNARHLVLAVPSAGLLGRLRGTLLERLASQLPGVHLHIQAAASGTEHPAGNVARPAVSCRRAAGARSASTSATRRAAAPRRRCWPKPPGARPGAVTW